MLWLHKRLWVAPMLVGVICAGVCRAADTRPSDEWFRNPGAPPPNTGAPGENGQTSSGRDFGGPPRMPPPNMLPTAAPPSAYSGSDFPDDEVHDWVMATVRAAHARAMFHRAERELNDSVRMVQWSFEQSKDYKDAAAAEKQAYDQYTAERHRALESVMKDPKYQAALELRDQVAEQIARLRAGSKPGDLPKEMLLAMASQKLQYASDAHNLETAATDQDAALQDARRKMVQASAHVAELRAQFDTSVRTNPQILQARRNLEDARVALITSEAYRDAAAAAGYLASDYAYYLHRWDNLRYGSGYRYGSDFNGPYGPGRY